MDKEIKFGLKMKIKNNNELIVLLQKLKKGIDIVYDTIDELNNFEIVIETESNEKYN